MAMGLGFLGRGNVTYAWKVGLLHVFGAVLGGALIGGLLGTGGMLLGLSAWRQVVIGVLALFALWHSLRRRGQGLGLQCQVPRKWARTLLPEPCYFAWGLLLGAGVATVIPYSAYLVLVGMQVTSGVALGAASGALFGGVREALALVPL